MPLTRPTRQPGENSSIVTRTLAHIPGHSSAQALLTADDVAARLRVSRSRAYEIMKEMPHVQIGRSIRVEEAEFQAWVRRHTKPARTHQWWKPATRDEPRPGTSGTYGR